MSADEPLPSAVSIAEELFCPGCGYDLRGIASANCPECGLAIDRQLIKQSILPWTHRHSIGRFRAFVRTVRLMLRDPGRIGFESARPSHRDAQYFRWIVVIVAAAPLCLAVLITRGAVGENTAALGLSNPFGVAAMTGTPPKMSMPMDLGICLLAGIAMWPVPSAALLLLLAGISGVPSYFFHPSTLPMARQNRAVALSRYACAPLVVIVPCSIALGTLVLISILNAGAGKLKSPSFEITTILSMVTALFGLVGAVAMPIWLWICNLRVLAATTHCSAARIVVAAILLPLIWVALVVLSLVLFPALCGFVRLMVLSYLR